ncbi:TIGR02680 family protein [Pseudonocardia sp.]|uniref:TIGR02680 family protein n=1 Tax=Pseudonocardia sp. TaxID=60912 RepID=UPI002620839F|nr:TIGR02680 family protein [Pseudonocardia sp.]
MTLPQPARARWQPLRAGLVDLFYYDVEEFWFHDGRLLLRGNNGTGKSKVLALLLPFLLDGDLSSHRVEPDADHKKRMEWNLLLGGEHPHPERLGYTWCEFGRLTEDGTAQFRTIGCGLKAVAGRGIARHWFFVTDQRVGADLQLVDATRTALTRERLTDALAGHGVVHDRARDYRRAVDEALFGLGEQRYGALVDLLVQLRQPQLSKRPSERALSDALTEALPPLDQAVVADVAEAFRSLEEDRDELAAMTEAHDSARAFLGHYRRYASVAARRRAALPRHAEQRYRSAREALAAAQEAHRVAEEAAEEAADRLATLEADAERLRVRDRTLRQSPEMRSAEQLERAADEARRRRRDADDAARRRTDAAADLDRRRARHDDAGRRTTALAAELAAARESATDAARTALVADPHATEIDARLTGTDAPPDGFGSPPDGIGSRPDGIDAPADRRLERLRRAATEITERQERAIRHVDTLLTAESAAARALADARATVDRLAGTAAELAERRAAAAEAVEERATELVAATRDHLDAAVELAVPEPDAVAAALELWAGTLDGPNPARVTADTAGRDATTALATAGAALEQRSDAAAAHAAELAAEITRLEAGEHGAPPAPHTRAPDARTGRSGAPLWQLVDFAEEVDDVTSGGTARAGLEAALEASGVLDAWLTPDGALTAPGGDVLIAPESGSVPGTAVATVLRPAIDPADPRAAAVPEEAVESVLAAIGLGAGPASTWVGTDGRFRIGVLTGAWSKPAAQYIGRGAREAARRARLVVVRAEADDVAAEQAAIATERKLLADRRDTLARELAGLPDDTPLREAHAATVALSGEHARLERERREADAHVDLATDRATTATEELHTGATDVGLPTDRPALDAVRDALAGYRVTLAGLWPAARGLADARNAERDTAAELAAARDAHAAAEDHAAEADRDARAAAEAHGTLRDTVGAAVEELQRLLAEVTELSLANSRDHRDATGARERAVAASGRADGLRQGATADLATATDERTAAADSLRRFAGTGLLTVALPELAVPDTWAPDPTVRLARQIDQELESVGADDPAWDRVQRRVTDELKTLSDTLARQGSTASAQLLEDGIVVEVVFRGRPATVPELTAALDTEVTDRSRLLDEREREILENHLVNEVASTLQELIAQAEQQVGVMNAELDGRPTSTGMRLRLEWRPREDGPAGLVEARRRLLRQTSDAWSEDDRAAVGGFLQARIAEVRARDETGTWLEHLDTALDYRGWHRFVIERHQNGQWRPATGPASGGERVLAASVPLFAAASAHYASAGNPHAPRLVTLDEAFAGVDDHARAKYLGLLAAFDLDVVMTSEREWGCYPEVPGLAIAQLARTDGIAAVLVTNWRWDGRQRRPVPRPVGAAAAPEPVAATGSLFDEL